jgi:hypothetical protein
MNIEKESEGQKRLYWLARKSLMADELAREGRPEHSKFCRGEVERDKIEVIDLLLREEIARLKKCDQQLKEMV